MVRVKYFGTYADLGKRGIHLLNPTKSEIEKYKVEANIKGFKTLWIHRSRLKKVI